MNIINNILVNDNIVVIFVIKMIINLKTHSSKAGDIYKVLFNIDFYYILPNGKIWFLY